MVRKKHVWAVLYGFLLLSFTVYVLLDTFVLTQVYRSAPSGQSENSDVENNLNQSYEEIGLVEESTEKENTEEDTSEDLSDASDIKPVTTMDSYQDENISIVITEYREYDTSIYVADIQLTSPEYLKTAFAQDAYGKNVTEKTSEIAENNGAILAINGDYYGAQEKGYVLRNGIVYRNTPSREKEDLVINADGSFSVISEKEISTDELLEKGVRQVLSFGPALIMDGNVSVTEGEEVGKAKASNPRTAIGIVDELHYIFVVSDGRTRESEGLSLYELAEFMQSLGINTAYNLDGGGSSTMYFNGEIINNPTSNGKSIKERSVSDIVYIGY